MKNVGITIKIWLSVGVFGVGFLLSVILGQLQSINTEHTLRAASEALFPAAQQSQEAASAFERAVKSFGDAVVMQDASGLDRAEQDGITSATCVKAIAGIRGLAPGRQAQVRRLSESIQKFVRDAKTVYAAVLANPANMNVETQDRVHGLATRTDALREELQATKSSLSRDLHSQLSATDLASLWQRRIAVIVFVLTIAIASLIVNLTIRRAITGPIVRVIAGVQQAADGASEASEKMAASGQIVARDSQEQAACVQETSASLEEINATTRQNADRAAEADRIMREAGNTVTQAAGAMNNLTASMAAISKSSKQVSDVLKSIDEIAFHTNILALNAAVEAARAGGAGAGFSVVADEVRSLAHRATDAARRSAQIIEKTIHDVATGVELVAVAHQAFSEVSSGILNGSTVVSQIAATSEEQARSIQHIGQAVSRIEKVTTSNAMNASQTADAASDMASEMETTRRHLDELVAVVGLQRR